MLGNSSDTGKIEDLPHRKVLENATRINSTYFCRNIFLQMLTKKFRLFLLILNVTFIEERLPEDWYSGLSEHHHFQNSVIVQIPQNNQLFAENLSLGRLWSF